jgi:diaminopimelate decarboxylase
VVEEKVAQDLLEEQVILRLQVRHKEIQVGTVMSKLGTEAVAAVAVQVLLAVLQTERLLVLVVLAPHLASLVLQ